MRKEMQERRKINLKVMVSSVGLEVVGDEHGVADSDELP
jgi:hypothetical protein